MAITPHNDCTLSEHSSLEGWNLPLSFVKKRHLESIKGTEIVAQSWRMKERMKTVSVALVVCLNVGVDPPDIVKTQPCARLECWIDPLSMSPQKALEMVGQNLQKQYERWQPRARYKQSLDPTVDEIKKLCTSLRRNAKEERVLFHYNGHGVPKPTSNGEIWVFNRTYTQYIPLSIYDLQTWMGAPSIYVYDCSNAGVIVDLFKQFAEQHEKEFEQASGQNSHSGSTPSFKNCIQLAACSADQILPMNPDLPADIFTSCLTTPIKIALRWFVMQDSSKLVPSITLDLIDKIPGQLNDRRTMLGELNWIFTAITDTIAWNILPRGFYSVACSNMLIVLIPFFIEETSKNGMGNRYDRPMLVCYSFSNELNVRDFLSYLNLKKMEGAVMRRDHLLNKLFRQDLLVASLFRNYLLAERIMRSYDCTPVSCPKLPSTFQHPMWQAWDLSLDLCLSQLPAVLESEDNYRHSPFFEEQLTAFEVWLEMGSDQRNPPEQLPIVLQVLLSQVHRLRALELLSRFLDLGAWAVNLALSVGIFPYMLKLLQSSARELRHLLVFIWAKILAVDSSCQVDLVRDNGYKYFLQILQDQTVQSDHKTIAAFAMTVIVKDYLPGQELAMQENLVSVCLEQINDANLQLKLWTIICLAKLWERYDKARWCGVRDSAHEKLFALLKSDEPEVRAAAVYALGTFMNTEMERSKHATNIDQSVSMMLINVVSQDMSFLVREELVNALQWVIMAFENSFLSVATQEMKATLPMSPQEQIVQIPSVMNTLKRNLSRERIKITFTGYYADNNSLENNTNQVERDSYPERLKRVSSSSSISSGSSASLPTVSYGSFYTKIWQGLASLEVDPYPKVAQMAHTLMDHIRDQVFEWPRHKEDVIDGPSSLGALYNVRDTVMGKEWIDPSKNASFFSLPPSPSNRSYLSVDSPPKNLSNTGSSVDLNRLGARMRYSLQHRRPIPNMISENASDNDHKLPLSTDFVDWCAKYFSEYRKPHADRCDIESSAHFEREWKYSRNHFQEKESRDDCMKAYQFHVGNQIFSTKCAQVPAVLLFHPYESHFITTAKDAFVVWDYNTNTKLTHWNAERGTWIRNVSRITALDLVNAHDNTMLLVGSEDGSVRLWSNYMHSVQNKEPILVTAWQALSELSSVGRTSSSVGLRVAWDQRSQTVLAGGDTRFIRVWDAESELKLADIPTSTEAWINSLSVDSDGGGNVFAAGCSDGSIRIFDRRLTPNSCRTITYREHTSVIINAKIRRCSDILVAGCMNGDVKTYDIRTKSSLLACRTGNRTTAFDVHKRADIFACGGASQLTAYEINGNVLNSVKNYDWFMTPKIASTVSHIAFHPNKVMMGYSSIDCNIVVSSLDCKKWPTNIN